LNPFSHKVLGREDPVTQLLCQAAYLQGSKQGLLLWAALGDHPLRSTIGIDDQGLLDASQALRQEVHPDCQVALVEPQQHDTDQQQGQKAVESMHRQFAIRPMIGPCTCTLRINTPGSSVDRHRTKKVYTRGLSWPPSGPLPLWMPSTQAVWTHVVCSGHFILPLLTTLRAHPPAGCGHGGTRKSSTSRSVQT
jgi:hypothetical protein